MNKWTLAADSDWTTLSTRLRALVPEAFGPAGDPLNLINGEWSQPGEGKPCRSSVDGSSLGRFPAIDLETARRAVRSAAMESRRWSRTNLDDRRQRVSATLERLKRARELLARLLVWEIGKPYAQALISVDRCISGVAWYVDQIESMLVGRRPLGLVSNIASWNYPMSVLMHAVLVQVLAGNAVIAKTPSDGGLFTLTLAMALARREGLPVSLVSGSGGQLSDALICHEEIACVSFVGGRNGGSEVAASLSGGRKRYMLEMEGINAYGVWNFSDWPTLAKQIRQGFDYAKQRCTAYPRYVIQRKLFPAFLETYFPAVQSLQFGHPFLVEEHGAKPPSLTYGPLINDRSAEELRARIREAIDQGAVALHEGRLEHGRFVAGQDTTAYLPPIALMNVPRKCRLYHAEPFGPVDTFVVVDSVQELIAEMNVSNGSLVASVACDDPKEARRIARELRAFKVGINRMRSRGDYDEPFGGIGASWTGCFVGGRQLVHAVTQGEPGERLQGNFAEYVLPPQSGLDSLIA